MEHPTTPLLAIILLLCVSAVCSQERLGGNTAFTVGDIRVEGLQRISEGTVYNYLPVNIGDMLDASRVREAIKALYATGFFQDVELRRDGSVLVVAVLERPTIESFEIKGNKDIKTDDLQKSLRNVGLATGKSFNRSVLEEVKQYLTEQYFARGKYSVSIDTQVQEVPGNRVKLKVDIHEGARAKIEQINIVGNTKFPDDELLDQLQLNKSNWLSWYKQDDRYAKEALSGDLETLRSYYMDRGYADFRIVSNQVALAPEKSGVFITINVEEGELYRVAEVKLAGTMVVPETELRRLLAVGAGETFSRRKVSQSTEAIRLRLGLDGYAFAKIDPVPKLDPQTKELSLSLVIDAGNRVYVRRINFSGTSGVNDEVFRREMRQLEGSYLSNAAVDRSKERIQRLPFIEKVEAETTPVPGTPDLVDVDFDIKEGLPGQFGGGIGYTEAQSVVLNGNIVHSNFLGTGQRVAVEFNGGQYYKSYDFSHTEPYMTMDGISRTLNFSYRSRSQLTSTSSEFSTKTWLTGTSFSYPLSEYQSLQLSASWQRVDLAIPDYSSQQFVDWVTANGNAYENDLGSFSILGTRYDAFELGLGWVYDSRDRSIFATRGAQHRLSMTATPPGSEVEYMIASYDYRQFFRLPLLRWLPLTFNTHVAYGQALGSTTALPPQRNLFVGGPGSLRGFRESTLGPRDSSGRPYGGDLAVTGQLEIIIPMPAKFASSARATVFYDFGQLAYVGDTEFTDKGGFETEYPFDLGFFRTSVGVGVEWLAPLGLFRFSYAVPLRYRRETELHYGDEREGFQFSIGNAF